MQPSESHVEQILARFPGPVTLYPLRGKWLQIFLFGCLATLGGILMVSGEKPGAWVVLMFATTCLIVSGVMLLPRASGLTLDGDGFLVTTLYRRHRFGWQNVSRFEPTAVGNLYARKDLVGFDNAEATGPIAKLSGVIGEHNAALADNYGLAINDLARLMTSWRERATAARP